MVLYSEKVMDHFRNPRNVGSIDNAECRDIMKIYLNIDNDMRCEFSYLFEREEIPSEIIRNSMRYSLDRCGKESVLGKNGTSRMAMMFFRLARRSRQGGAFVH